MHKTYFNGDAAVYTGESKIFGAGRAWEIELVEGHLLGRKKWTYVPPGENNTKERNWTVNPQLD